MDGKSQLKKQGTLTIDVMQEKLRHLSFNNPDIHSSLNMRILDL